MLTLRMLVTMMLLLLCTLHFAATLLCSMYTEQYEFVVRLLGACTVRPNICLVYEDAPRSLYHLLHKCDVSIPIEEKAGMLYDIARGIQAWRLSSLIWERFMRQGGVVLAHV